MKTCPQCNKKFNGQPSYCPHCDQKIKYDGESGEIFVDSTFIDAALELVSDIGEAIADTTGEAVEAVVDAFGGGGASGDW